MKIRADFVTNSSSVSYILTMKEDMVSLMRELITDEKKPLYDAIANIIREGEQNTVCAENIRSTLIKFDTGDGVGEQEIDNPPDYSVLAVEDMMPYLYCYILNGRLPEFMVFGATQVETF